MDIIRIAQREANRAADQAQTAEGQYDAYRTAIEETIKRGRKAEELLEAGAVSRNGGPGRFYVQSQDNGDRYTVDLNENACDCPDRTHRPWLCKHLQAAELYQGAQPEDPEAAPDQVVLEVTGYKRGRQLVDKRVQRVRIGEGTYREARDQNFDNALHWLQSKGYELADVVAPSYTAGTAEILYIYRIPDTAEDHDDALPADRPRQRDRLFKGGAR